MNKNKVIKITLTVVGAAAAVIGAGLIGGTYGSYSNYQNITTIDNYYYNQYKAECPISISSWNAYYVNNESNDFESKKEQFFADYSPYDNYYKKIMSATSPWDLTSILMFPPENKSDQTIKDSYDANVAYYSLNYNYDASQAGVIAGSVILSVGLITFISFLVILLRKKKL